MAGPSRQTRDSASTARATGLCSQAAEMCEATARGATGRSVAQAARNARQSLGGLMRRWDKAPRPSACQCYGCRANEGNIVPAHHDSTAPANCGRGAGSRLDGGSGCATAANAIRQRLNCRGRLCPGGGAGDRPVVRVHHSHSAPTADLDIRPSSLCFVGAATTGVDHVGLRLVRPHVAIHPSCQPAAGPNRLAARAARWHSNRSTATGASGLRASHGSQAGAVVAGWHCHGLLHPRRSSAPPVWPVLHIPLRVTHGHPS